MHNELEIHGDVRSARENSHWSMEQVSSIFHASVQVSQTEFHTTATQPGLFILRIGAQPDSLSTQPYELDWTKDRAHS